MHATLIYDGDCPMCRKAMAWVELRAATSEIERLPFQSTERAERFPHISEADCMRAMQFVLDDGTVYSGAVALPHILRRVRGWRWLARVLRLPVISWFAPFVYAAIARNRQTISLLVREKSPAVPCNEGVCAVDPERR